MSNIRRHVVIGGNGSVGKFIVDELRKTGEEAFVLHRAAVNDPGSRTADALNREQLIAATRDATHIYVCLGIAYDTKVWQRDWPAIVENVIAAANQADARIIFLDNIYMYGPKPLANPITEDHPLNPSSEKGKVRKQVAQTLLDAHKSGTVKAVIGRCADFYGPGVTNGMLYITVLKNMLAGRRPQWMGNPAALHSFVHVGDAARALIALAMAEDTYGEVWLLPAAKPTHSVQSLVDIMGQLLEKPSKLIVLPNFAIGLLAAFVPIVRELKEMLYQYETDYVIASHKFAKRFPDFVATPYSEGIAEMVRSFQPSAPLESGHAVAP